MELLESDDSLKSLLLKRSAQQREELEGEFKQVSDRTEKIITNALIIGGTLAVTYFLFRQFSGSKSKSKARSKKANVLNTDHATEEEAAAAASTTTPLQGIATQIGTALASQATMFLLSLAKEKLAEYLQVQAEKKESK